MTLYWPELTRVLVPGQVLWSQLILAALVPVGAGVRQQVDQAVGDVGHVAIAMTW